MGSAARTDPDSCRWLFVRDRPGLLGIVLPLRFGVDGLFAVIRRRRFDGGRAQRFGKPAAAGEQVLGGLRHRSEEHTSALQSLMRISYAVFCLKKKNTRTKQRIEDFCTYNVTAA